MSSVAAVVIVAILFRLFAAQPKARNYILATILGVQGIQLWMGTDYRWNQAPWNNHWIDVTLPARLASEPNLYLTIGGQTNSFLAPYFAPGSGLVNFSGGYTLSSDGANRKRIDSLLNRFAPNIRVLIRGERLYRDDERLTPNAPQIDDALRPFNLRVEQSDCATIAVHGLTPEMQFTFSSSRSEKPQSKDTTYLLSCRLSPDNAAYSAQAPAHRELDLTLDRLEDACPALFQPRRPRTEYIGDGGLRRYANTDLAAWVSHGGVKFQQPTIGGDMTYLGRESAWVKAPIPIQCGRRNGRFFALLPESTGSQ